MNARHLVRALACSVLFFAIGASALNAQGGAYKRLKLIEEFSSATCGPCVLYNPVVKACTDINKGVVSIVYHQNFPAPGDPFYVANASEAQARLSFYGMNSIPNVAVQGVQHNTVIQTDPTPGIVDLNSTLNSVTPTSPVMMTIVQDKGTLKVTVKSDIAISNYTLQVVICSREVNLPNIKKTLAGSNGVTVFEYAMMDMVPDDKGTAVSLSAGETKTFTFPAALGTTEIWPDGQQYAIAFLQSNTSKDVIQAAVTNDGNSPLDYTYLKATSVTATISGLYERVGRGVVNEKTITLTNSGTTSASVNFAVTNAADLTKAGFTTSIEPSTATLAAGATTTVKLKVTGPLDHSDFQSVNVSMYTADLLGRIVPTVNYLVDGTKAVVWNGVGSQGLEILTEWSVQTTPYNLDHVFLPFSAEVIAAYPASTFPVNIFNMDAAWTNFRGAVLTQTQAALAAKKGVWVSGQNNLYATFDRYKDNSAYAAAQDFYLNTAGVTLDHLSWRAIFDANGNPTAVVRFSAAGVAKDPIGDGLTLGMNNLQSANSWYYALGVDIMKKSPGSKAVTFLYYSDKVDSIAGVHTEVTGGGRLVLTSAGLEAMAVASERLKYTQRVIDWLLNGAPEKGDLTASAGTLTFGQIEVDATKDMAVEITNTSTKASVKITDITVTGADAASFDVFAGGTENGSITLVPGAKHTISVRFSPTSKKPSFQATMTVVSDANSNPVVQLRGSSKITSVETDVVSANGAIGMRLAGSNPVSDASAIELTTNGAGTSAINVSIVDAAGRTVSTIFDGSVPAGSQRIALNGATLANGTYTVVASNGSERAMLTIVVSR